MIQLIKQYQGYKVLAEDPNTLDFVKIDNVTNETLKRYRVYEIDHEQKRIFLELNQASKFILITTGDSLELPLTTAKNINEAAQYMQVEATHVYRAWRNAGKPNILVYKNFKLIFM